MSFIFTVTGQYAGQLQEQLAVIQTNLVVHLLHLGWDWRGWHDDLGNGRLGSCHGLIIGNTWLLVVCDVDSGSQGVMNRMEGLFIADLSVMVSCSMAGSE